MQTASRTGLLPKREGGFSDRSFDRNQENALTFPRGATGRGNADGGSRTRADVRDLRVPCDRTGLQGLSLMPTRGILHLEMSVIVFSCSLHPASRSAVLAGHAVRVLKQRRDDVQLIDLREWPLPLCDGTSTQDPGGMVTRLSALIADADAILLAVPIYNWMMNAAAKNLVEHTGSAWRGKRVGLMCAAGGRSSYMSVMSLGNALALDFRCQVLPSFVYAVGSDYEGDAVVGAVAERVERLCEEISRRDPQWNTQRQVEASMSVEV